MKWQDIRSFPALYEFTTQFEALDAHDKVLITKEMTEFLENHKLFLHEVQGKAGLVTQKRKRRSRRPRSA